MEGGDGGTGREGTEEGTRRRGEGDGRVLGGGQRGTERGWNCSHQRAAAGFDAHRQSLPGQGACSLLGNYLVNYRSGIALASELQ